MDEDTPYIPAATLILLRERLDGAPEVLMLERAAGMAFAGGALVFPGGRVDDDDWAFADAFGAKDDPDRDERAQRIAAIRETIEEVGIAVGIDPLPDASTMAVLREGLAAGRAFADLLAEAGLALNPGVLAPFARWRPGRGQISRQFDTRFFLAASPPGAVETADGGESVRALWATVRELIDAAEAGHHRVIFPTRCNLDRLAQFESLAEAIADGARYAHQLASGRIERRDDGEWLCIDEGIGYPVTARRLDESLRG